MLKDRNLVLTVGLGPEISFHAVSEYFVVVVVVEVVIYYYLGTGCLSFHFTSRLLCLLCLFGASLIAEAV